MLKKLRSKFIILNMSIVAAVLFFAFGTICFLTYSQDLASVNALMKETLDRASSARVLSYSDLSMLEPGGAEEAPDGESVLAPNNDSGDAFGAFDGSTSPNSGSLQPPEIGGGDITRSQLTPIVAYAVDSQGVIISLSAFSTALIPDEYLSRAITDALAAQDDFGTISDLGLLYGRRVQSGVSYLTFADVSAVEGWETLALILCGVGLFMLAGFLIISLFFSRWALRPVERAWDQQQQFVADASHELKTPLTVILANTAIVRAHPEKSIASQSQWIESTQTEAERMQELVNDMLDLARPENAARTQASFADVDLSDLVEGEVLQFESVAFDQGIEMTSAIAPAVRLRGDVRRLQRMVTTLIDNACKYTDLGGQVHVALTQTSREVRLSVRNTGTVIDAADIPHVFDRFYRADRSRTHSSKEAGGYGLGLAIAQEIAHEHSGEITVTSTAAEGTTFIITLPL